MANLLYIYGGYQYFHSKLALLEIHNFAGQYRLLTNSEAGRLWGFTSSTVGDNTSVIACIACHDSSEFQSTIFHFLEQTSITEEILPVLVSPPPPSRPPLPLVTERFRSSGFDGESHRFSWRNILQLLGLTDNSGRLSYRRSMTVTIYWYASILSPATPLSPLTRIFGLKI